MEQGTLIVGGGVIGLACGWVLCKRGERVLLCERGEAGKEASWAAAGMLAPSSEVELGEEDVNWLGRESLRLYPDFVKELEAASGERVEFRQEGTLQLALDADELRELERRFERQRKMKAEVRWLSGEEAQDLERGLSPRVVGGIDAFGDYQVDNRQLVRALRQAFLSEGGELREHCEVEALLPRNGGAPGVRAAGEELYYQRVLLTAGCWSGSIAGLDCLGSLPLRPIKGQMLCLRSPLNAAPRHVLRGHGVYLTPRGDGRVLVGASVEERGFNKQLTAGVLFSLLREARRLLPGVDEWPMEEAWAGLRPGTRDNAPIMGQLAAGLFVATGHYRNGILHTPITAYSLSRLMLDNHCPPVIQPFSAKRFQVP